MCSSCLEALRGPSGSKRNLGSDGDGQSGLDHLGPGAWIVVEVDKSRMGSWDDGGNWCGRDHNMQRLSVLGEEQF